jgi:flagellar basal-body rod modification protein FlgD
MVNGITPNVQAAAAAETSASTGTSTKTSGTNGVDTTFLKLLVTELKTQDPTSPMDSTQMVSQMIGLNQLNQLIAIREIMDGTTSSK